MIEFELKYRITMRDRLRLLMRDVKPSVQKDIYYDTAEGLLYRAGNFLRVRNDTRIDFKLYAGDDTHLFCEETNFLADRVSSDNAAYQLVCQRVGLTGKSFANFDEFVGSYSLGVLAPIVKRRSVARLDDVILSLDEIEGVGTFLEAERDFPDAGFDKEVARAQLERYLVEQGLIDLQYDQAVKIGYVELYLKEHCPALYEQGKYKE